MLFRSLEEHADVFNELDTKVREAFKAERKPGGPVSVDEEEPEDE